MPQKLFIPYIGSVIVLTEDWTFQLHFEEYHKRNTLLTALCPLKRPDRPVKPANKRDYSIPYDRVGWDQYYQDERAYKLHGMEVSDWADDIRLRVERAMTEEELAVAPRTYRSTRKKDRHYVMATLPAGTPLRIDRVYIKRGIDAYSSLTFGIPKECKDKVIRGKKFWASLKDVNNIVCEPI